MAELFKEIKLGLENYLNLANYIKVEAAKNKSPIPNK